MPKKPRWEFVEGKHKPKAKPKSLYPEVDPYYPNVGTHSPADILEMIKHPKKKPKPKKKKK